MGSCFSALTRNCCMRKSQADCASPEDRAGLGSSFQAPFRYSEFKGVRHAHTADRMLNTDYCFLDRWDIRCISQRMQCLAQPGEMLGSSAEYWVRLLNENRIKPQSKQVLPQECTDLNIWIDLIPLQRHSTSCSATSCWWCLYSAAWPKEIVHQCIVLFANGDGRQAYNYYQHRLICICTNIPNQNETAGSVLAQ